MLFLFLKNDLEERNTRWVKKIIKRFNMYARYVVDHWKSPWAQQGHIRRQLKTRDDPERRLWLKELMVSTNRSTSQITEFKSILEERFILSAGLGKLSIEIGLVYENSKKEKRIMDIKEILKIYDATRKRVLKKVTDIQKKTKTRQKLNKTKNEIGKRVENQSRRRMYLSGTTQPKDQLLQSSGVPAGLGRILKNLLDRVSQLH
ncbi:hypothetical protein Tco_0580859 [Tanacetum coccineum]